MRSNTSMEVFYVDVNGVDVRIDAVTAEMLEELSDADMLHVALWYRELAVVFQRRIRELEVVVENVMKDKPCLLD